MSATPDQRLMTRFLLNDLSAQEREDVQERAAVDETFFDQLREHEDDLILSAIRGELPAHEQSLFETAYVGSAARRERVASARALLEAAEQIEIAAPTRGLSWRRPREWLLSGSRPAYALAAAALLGVSLATYFALGGAFAGDGRLTSSASHDVLVHRFAAVDDRRAPGAGAATPTLHVSSGASAVRFEVPLSVRLESLQGITVRLSRIDGAPIDSRGRVALIEDGAAVSLSIPVTELPPGDYALTVSGPAGGPDLAAHALRVRRD